MKFEGKNVHIASKVNIGKNVKIGDKLLIFKENMSIL